VGRQERERRRNARRQLSTWTRRWVIAWSLFALAFLVAVQHVFAHLGWRPLPFSMGWQDILLGYPAAALIALAGLLTLDPERPS